MKFGISCGWTRRRESCENLSAREREVFRWIGEGLEPREIAEKLGVSAKTVESYRARIKLKLNLRSGTELIRHAVRWGLKSGSG